MIFYRATIVATATLLSVLQSNIGFVSSLSTSPASAASRRDVLSQSTKVIFGAATSSLLAVSPAGVHATEGFQDGPDGLRYVVTKEGSGPKPERGQKIETSYTLWINGFPGEETGSDKAKQIDSSKKPILGDSPFKVRAGVKQVIRGWDLTLLDMKEGESRKIVVPPALGYGAKGVGPIPGNCVLYFEMTLTKVGPVEELTADAKKWLEENPL
mmetsp:Transcript_7669/g.15770  ORF Transcript_7669/g.15770 Transcript_7669/m.15770 type:complete len:213 (+) Transcript_7669:353-991(+)|eukprot:CAMPEP_0201129368 /NCGR_PEP_ID=MMETSP0850-20130426/36704_1 /ASSEMBLY_ACC=CAM_ASM_000622 /TAXON_ID=183588 /ORGANISM="Pseudo-nitzschia fraudulenta, Strain WWA7" /LENGTH=212 /DNA_ID=CAMNT_0047398825 /DNA_START=364 /DNA_END=1002 /DNA_ORIENTATION=-